MTVTRRTSSFSDKLFGRLSPSTTLNSTDGTPTADTHIPDPKPYGLKVLYHPPREDPVADILFVHGIKGHRENTWAQGHGGRPWPQTLLPLHLPNVRVLTFGYDANPIAWRASVSVNRIGDHSKNLLAALAAHRENTSRPLIIVAHSLGGLVCKDALITSRSSADKRIRRIYDCSRGVIFLGTPHTGASLATAANRLARVLALTTSKSNLRILRVLERNSEVLARIQSEFYTLLQASTFQVTCFYEELKYPGIGDVIVSADSAVLPGYMGIGIHAHHKDIARFADENSPGFDNVLGELQRWVTDTTYVGNFTTSAPDKESFMGSNATGRTGGGFNGSGIEIWGDVIRSNVVNGSQTVHGNITFSGS